MNYGSIRWFVYLVNRLRFWCLLICTLNITFGPLFLLFARTTEMEIVTPQADVFGEGHLGDVDDVSEVSFWGRCRDPEGHVEV